MHILHPLLFFPDLEYNPEDYVPLVEHIKNDEADVVYGSRFADKRNKGNFLFLSFVANKTLTLMTQILFGTKLTDMETCYKAFKSEVIKMLKSNLIVLILNLKSQQKFLRKKLDFTSFQYLIMHVQMTKAKK